MCVILIKKAGTPMPTKKDLELCWKINSHGAGFSYRAPKSKVVHYEKGFKVFEEFYDRVKDFKKEDEVVMHFRIATQGGINPQMCHPFPLSPKCSDMMKLKGDEKAVVFHNGIIRLTSKPELKGQYPAESDTAIFVRKFAYPLLKNGFSQLALDGIEELVGPSNRLVIHTDKGLYGIGYFYKAANGCFYSNTYSMPCTYSSKQDYQW